MGVVIPDEVRLELLGDMRLTVDGENVEPPTNRKARALLAYLARRPGRHAREKLAGLLWPYAAKENGRRSLRVALTKLRRLLPERMQADRRYVALDRGHEFSLDLDELLDLHQAESDPVRRLARLRELWRGELLRTLDGVESPTFQEWLLLEREHARQQTLSQLHRLADELEGVGDADGSRQALRMILQLNPVEERAHRLLMLALARAGEHEAALAQFESCRELLADELDVEPTEATQKAAERIRRLRERPRHNLPQRPIPLLGREHELGQLRELVLGEARLVTVFGPPGVGKTRLAMELARQCAASFFDGAAFIPLAAVTEAGRLASVVAHHLGKLAAIRPLHGAADPGQHLLSELEQLELLLFLDNYEQLLPNVDILLDILQRAQDVTLLLTSRARLDLRWERLFELDGLAVPAAPEVAGWSDYGAVQLFLHEAERAQPGYRLGRDDRATLTELLQRTEGFPLAIELAAAELRSRSLEELCQLMSEDPGAMSSGPRDLPHRQRSLWAAIDTSWDSLTAEQQRLFAQLAVFRGGFDAQAAVAVAGGDRNALIQLSDAALLRQEGSGSARYDLHELLRQYAEHRLEEGHAEPAAVRQRHSAHFGGLTAREGAEMLMGERQREARNTLLTDWENLLRGWRTAMQQRAEDTLSAYVIGLWLVYEQMGWYQEGYDFFGRAVRQLESWRPAEPPNPFLEGQLRVRLGWFRFRTGMIVGAAAEMERGERLLEPLDERGNDVGFARATRALTWILRGGYERAAELLDSTRELAQERGSVFALAAMRTYQSMNALARGDLDLAETAVEESFRLADELGDRRMVALAHVYRGNLRLLQGDQGSATQAFDQGLDETRAFGDPWIEVLALHGLGTLKLEAGEWQRAGDHFSRGLALSREIGEVRGVCMCLNGLAQAAHGAGQVREACTHFRQAFAQSSKAGLTPEALAALGGISLLEDDADEGRRAARRIRRILDDPGLAELDRRWLVRSAPGAASAHGRWPSGRSLAAVVERWLAGSGQNESTSSRALPPE